RTEGGLLGRVVQDVVTAPPVKRAILQGTKGTLEMRIGGSPCGDLVVQRTPGEPDQVTEICKTRPDDFIDELTHVAAHLDSNSSPIRLERGLDTMLVLTAAHAGESAGRRVAIDYTAGYVPAAIRR